MASQLSKVAVGGSLVVLIVSVPPLFLFINSARLLLQYEDMTKKAAKFSSEAGRQLRKTRTTQGSAVFASVLSTISAAYILLFPNGSGSIAIANVICCLAAADHVGGFWKGAMKAPPGLGGSEYNDAVRATEQGLKWLNRLAVGWSVMGIAQFVLGFLLK